MSIVLQGSTSGSITLQEPAVAGSTVLSLPATTGTVLTSASPSSDLPSSINGPAFSAYGGGQSLSANTWTKIQANTEEFDTASCYDNSTNYRFTPNVAGYYQVNGNVETNAQSSVATSLYKNGVEFKRGANLTTGSATSYVTSSVVSALIYMNGSSDYLELYVYVNNSGLVVASSAPYRNYFQAAMVRAA